MKRLLQFVMALSLLGIVVTPASAQQPESPWRLGLQAGAAYSNLSGDTLTSSDAVWGPFVGFSAEYFFANSFSIEIEGNYLQKGAENGRVGDNTFKMNIKYFELPIILNGYYAFSESFLGSLYAGLALAAKVSCDLTVGDQPQTDCGQAQITGEAEGIEWSVPLGGGVAYKFPGKNSLLRLDVRYSMGLSNVTKRLDLTTRTWEFIVGYGFGI